MSLQLYHQVQAKPPVCLKWFTTTARIINAELEKFSGCPPNLKQANANHPIFVKKTNDDGTPYEAPGNSVCYERFQPELIAVKGGMEKATQV